MRSNSPHPPTLLTFTGADDFTSIPDMVELAQRRPIEWGILFSEKRQGMPRYPSLQWVRALLAAARDGGVHLSAHLCGEYSRLVTTGRPCGLESLLGDFARVQINTASQVDPAVVLRWASTIGAMPPRPILQCRGDFPVSDEVDWLYDPSGGHGLHPTTWPAAPLGRRVGYAGGLNPSNIAQVVSTVGSATASYWMDLETGARDENDRFSIPRCVSVCDVVWSSDAESRADANTTSQGDAAAMSTRMRSSA
jgi:hypothetical protein